MSDETLRAFFALELPAEARERAAEARQALRAAVPEGVRWVPSDNLHLTLKFLGDVGSREVPRLVARAEAKLQAIAPFELELTGFGALPNARAARVLWLGVGKGGRELARIARKLDAAAASIGVERERRPFRAHLTLGRLRRPQRVQIERLEAPGGIAFSVEEVILYESRLSSDGARYVPLARLPLVEVEDAEAREFAPEI
ncbi:MAG: RNA 2',3'-cyclic phosphodiesterase [Myxococcota bacterium]